MDEPKKDRSALRCISITVMGQVFVRHSAACDCDVVVPWSGREESLPDEAQDEK